MGSVGREQSDFASTRAREVKSQKEMMPDWKGEERSASADLLLVNAVKGWGSQPRWLLNARNIRMKRRSGSTIDLLLRMLIMLLASWNVHHGKVRG